MCEANAYILEDGTEKLFLEAVDVVMPQENGGYRLVNIYGEQKICSGRLKSMKLVEHRILFES